MADPILVEAPDDLLGLDEAKAHLRVDHDDEDDLIAGLVAAAAAYLDGWQGVLGRCIMTQTWAVSSASLASQCLPFPDAQSAVVSYLDADGDSQTVDPADYRVSSIRGKGHLIFASDFSAPALLAGRDDAVTITAVYGNDVAPPALKAAALMLVGHWYRNREGGTDDIPAPVKALIAPHRVGLI